MFQVGDKAKVLTEIIRKDGKSIARVGELVTITHVFNSADGETQIVGIDFPDNRLPMMDIVLFKNSLVLQKEM